MSLPSLGAWLGRDQEVAMSVAEFLRQKPRFGIWAKIVPAAVALALLAGCVVVPAYGPGPGYYRGYYAPGSYYRDRDDYYRRW
jgi:hypothetical protein